MKFIGRAAQHEALITTLLDALGNARGRVLLLEGPTGIGKSTLAGEVLDSLAERLPGTRVARGRCIQTFGSADPYLPFIEALRDLSSRAPPGTSSEPRLAGLLRELAPYWLQVVPLVGGLLSATFVTATEVRGRIRGGNAPSREALFVQYLDLIRRLAQDAPFVLLLDDLHWADQASLALLGYLARGIVELPIAIVATLRTDPESERAELAELLPELEREGIGMRVPLGELPPDEVRLILEQVFGDEVSEPLRRWLERAAGGNPLFLTELARLVRENGDAKLERGEWVLARPDTRIHLPRSAEAVIERRIQRLEADHIRLLQYASIDGDEFESVVLAQLLERDELDVLDTLERIRREHGLVTPVEERTLPDGDIATVFRFHHTAVRTVLYEQVQGKRRILLHRRAGEIIEKLFPEPTPAIAGRLARHYHEGRVAASAFRFASLAGDAARRVFAHWEALEFIEIALAHAPDDVQRAVLHERAGDVLHTLGRYEAALQRYRESAVGAAGQEHELRLERKIAAVERKAALVPAPELYERLRRLVLRASAAPEERCRILLELARLPDTSTDVDPAAEALDIAESLDDQELLAAALEQLAVRRMFVEGRTADAFPLLARCMEIARLMQDPVRIARYHNGMGVAHARLGHYREALAEFNGMLSVYERIGDPNGIGAACCNIGVLQLRLGSYDEAEAMLQRARSIHERRDRASALESLFGLAERARLTGDFELAAERYRALLERATRFQYWTSIAVAHAGLGLCALETGRDAADHAAAIIEAVDSRDQWFEDRDIVELFLARCEAMGGATDRADVRLKRAAAALAPRDVYLWARIQLERAALLRDTDPQTARKIISEAVEATSAVQSPPLHEDFQTFGALVAAS